MSRMTYRTVAFAADRRTFAGISLCEEMNLEAAIDLSKWEGQRNKAIIENLFLLRIASYGTGESQDQSDLWG